MRTITLDSYCSENNCWAGCCEDLCGGRGAAGLEGCASGAFAKEAEIDRRGASAMVAGRANDGGVIRFGCDVCISIARFENLSS